MEPTPWYKFNNGDVIWSCEWIKGTDHRQEHHILRQITVSPVEGGYRDCQTGEIYTIEDWCYTLHTETGHKMLLEKTSDNPCFINNLVTGLLTVCDGLVYADRAHEDFGEDVDITAVHYGKNDWKGLLYLRPGFQIDAHRKIQFKQELEALIQKNG